NLLPGDSVLAEAEAFLQTHEAALASVLAASQQPGECHFPVKFEDGFSMKLEHVNDLRTLARLLMLAARVRAAKGDRDGALEAVQALYSVSQALAHELTLVSHLVRIATLGVAITETERIINEMQLTDEQLASLQAKLDGRAVQANLTTALLGE